MTVYKVRAYVNKRTSKGADKEALYKETVVLDNLQTAESIYKAYKNDCETYTQYSGYHGACELFVPHIFEDGTLAYWPDKEQYIERTEW